MYELKEKGFFEYELTDERKTWFALKDEHHVIHEWANYLENELQFYADNDGGELLHRKHCDQFGRIMFELYSFCTNPSEMWDEYAELLQSMRPIQHIAQGPSGTEDRTWYRAWLMIIEHPNYNIKMKDGWGLDPLLETFFVLKAMLDRIQSQLQTMEMKDFY